MPKRPTSHILEDLAKAKLRETFAQEGWVTEDLDEDYGEDMLVRVFHQGEATNLAFFVQSKATNDTEQYQLQKTQEFSYAVRADHVRLWQDFWEPVVLTLYDAPRKCFFWETVQTYIERNQASARRRLRTQKMVNIRIPSDNRLDDEGLKRILARTKERFARFQKEKDGAEHLLEVLEEQLDLKVEYDPQEGILMFPKGRFQSSENHEHNVVLFGKAAARLQRMQKQFGFDPQDLFYKSLDLASKIVKAYEAGGYLLLRHEDTGEEIHWKDLDALLRHVDRRSELEEAE